MLPFKKGPFFLAMASGAPCIPVSIHGTETMLRKGSLRIRPGTAHVIFHQPIDPRALPRATSSCEPSAPPSLRPPRWMRTSSSTELPRNIGRTASRPSCALAEG